MSFRVTGRSPVPKRRRSEGVVFGYSLVDDRMGGVDE